MQVLVVLCAGATQPAFEYISQWQAMYDAVKFVGIDRGALRLVKAGYTLDLAVGDFDSVNDAEFALIQENSRELFRFQAEKDDTDAAIGLQYASERWPDAEYRLLGFLGENGGRLDHQLSNLWLGHQERYALLLERLRFVESHHQVSYLTPGAYTFKYETCRYFSVISMTPVTQLVIEGAKYTLAATDFDRPQSLISNEYTEQQPIHLSFTSGLMIVMWVNRQ